MNKKTMLIVLLLLVLIAGPLGLALYKKLTD